METILPSGFTITLVSKTDLLIYKLCVADNVPQIKASVTVRADLSVSATFDDKIVPVSQYRDIVDGPVKQMSQLLNLMA